MLPVLDSLDRLLTTYVKNCGSEEFDTACASLRIKEICRNSHLALKEAHTSYNGLSKVEIYGLTGESLVLKPDHFSIRYFAGGTWNKCCDYILLTEFRGSRYAYFVDLKTNLSENPDADDVLTQDDDYDIDIAWQMHGANRLLNSLFDVLHTERGIARAELDSFTRKYAIFYKGVKKMPSKATTGMVHATTGISRPRAKEINDFIYAIKASSNQRFAFDSLL